jgi:hypothetical protein
MITDYEIWINESSTILDDILQTIAEKGYRAKALGHRKLPKLSERPTVCILADQRWKGGNTLGEVNLFVCDRGCAGVLCEGYSLKVTLIKQPPVKWKKQIRHIIKVSSILFALLHWQYYMNNAYCSPAFYSIV